jgi:hypothetical protein
VVDGERQPRPYRDRVEENEVLEILGELESTLEELGYDSMVEQERRAAAEGRVIETTKEDRALFGKRGTLRPEVGDVRRTPLSADERLSMLIDLLDVAVGATFAIEERLLLFAEQNFPQSTSRGYLPTFRPDPEEGFAVDDDRVWALSARGDLAERRSAVRQVLTDLDQLREAVGVERDPILAADSNRQQELSNRTLGWA